MLYHLITLRAFTCIIRSTRINQRFPLAEEDVSVTNHKRYQLRQGLELRPSHLARQMFARHASATLRRTGASLLINSSVKATRASVPALCNWGAAASGLPISSNLRSFQSSPITSGNASASASAMEGSAKVRFSAGADETALTAALQELLGSAGKGGRWSLIPNGQGLERGFKFKTFVKTWVSLGPSSFSPGFSCC